MVKAFDSNQKEHIDLYYNDSVGLDRSVKQMIKWYTDYKNSIDN